MKSKFLEGATVSEVFDKIDENHSNQLEYDEYLFFARNTCGITTDQISDQKLCQLFGVVDADNNGAIDLKELMQFIEAPSLSIPSSTHPRASLALAPPKSTKQVLKRAAPVIFCCRFIHRRPLRRPLGQFVRAAGLRP